MFEKLDEINRRPGVFSLYTAEALWADEYRAKQMLGFHLNEHIDVSSRNADFIDASAAWMIDYFDLEAGKSVCDFGCGPGLYTSRLATSAAHVTGLDFSEHSIQHAREQAEINNQKIDYIHANYLEFEPNKEFDLITLIMCDYCALGPSQRKRLLGILHGSLKTGGAILLDVYSMAAFADRTEDSFYEKNQLDHFWSKDDYYCFVNTFKYEDEAVVLDKCSIFGESGETETIYNWLQYFSQSSLSEELSRAGFVVEKLYKDVCGRPFSEQHLEFAIVATKRA